MEIEAGVEETLSPGEEELEEAVGTPEEEIETSEEPAIDANKVYALEQEIGRLREKAKDQDRAIDFFQQLVNRDQRTQEPEEPDLPDDELVDMGTVRKFFKQKESELSAEQRKIRVQASEDKLQAEVPEWPEIYNAVVKQRYETDPAFMNYIINSPDPAREAYNWAVRQDTYKKLFGKTQGKTQPDDVAKAQKNAKRPKTLSELGGASEKKVDWDKMSREEFLKIANQNSFD